MTDEDVQREIEANERRAEAREDRAEDDGPVIDTAEAAIDPLANVIRGPNDDDEELVEERRELNDEAQRDR